VQEERKPWRFEALPILLERIPITYGTDDASAVIGSVVEVLRDVAEPPFGQSFNVAEHLKVRSSSTASRPSISNVRSQKPSSPAD
jgi:hypothetical protein